MRHHLFVGLIAGLLVVAAITTARADVALPPDPPQLPGSVFGGIGGPPPLGPFLLPPSNFLDSQLDAFDNTSTDAFTNEPLLLPMVLRDFVIQTFAFVRPGFVILLENRNGDTSPSNWSDVILFQNPQFGDPQHPFSFPNPAMQDNIFRFFSEPNLAPLIGRAADVLSTNPVFRYEVQAAVTGEPGDLPDVPGLTEYNAGNVIYNIRSDPAPAPEPSTWLLLGSGIVGLIVWRRYAHAA